MGEMMTGARSVKLVKRWADVAALRSITTTASDPPEHVADVWAVVGTTAT